MAMCVCCCQARLCGCVWFGMRDRVSFLQGVDMSYNTQSHPDCPAAKIQPRYVVQPENLLLHTPLVLLTHPHWKHTIQSVISRVHVKSTLEMWHTLLLNFINKPTCLHLSLVCKCILFMHYTRIYYTQRLRLLMSKCIQIGDVMILFILLMEQKMTTLIFADVMITERMGR